MESHLLSFATPLIDSGYRDKDDSGQIVLARRTGWWFGRNKRVMSQLDESLVDAFAKRKRRIRALDLPTLRQFVDHLRKCNVIPYRKLAPDKSPLAEILGAYERYLREERGLVLCTIRRHQSYVSDVSHQAVRKETARS